MTIRDLITSTLQDLGVIAAGEQPSAEDAADALSRLQDWVDGLATEGLTVYTVTRTTWTLTTAASYTVGTGGTINIPRPTGPEAIQNIGYQDTALSPVAEMLLGRPLTEDQYAAIAQKTLEGPYPARFYYNPTYPLGTLKPWPIPTSGTLEGVIYAPTPLTEPASLDTVIALPPGYRRFYRTNLALEIADAFDAAVTPLMDRKARDAKNAIKRANLRLLDMSVDSAAAIGARGRSNIYLGAE